MSLRDTEDDMGYRAVAYIKPSGRPIRTRAFTTENEAKAAEKKRFGPREYQIEVEMNCPDSLAARLSINIHAR